MNFFNDRELALRFKNDAVPSRERLIYLLIFLIFTALLSSTLVINSLANPTANHWDHLYDVFYVLITVAGTCVCYLTNKVGDDREFTDRYISIGFPVLMKWTVIFIIAITATFLIVDFVLVDDFLQESGPIDIISEVVFLTSYFWRLNSSIRLASH